MKRPGRLGQTDWGGIVQAGAGIYQSYMGMRTQESANEAAAEQARLQLQAQREAAQYNIQASAQSFEQTMKVVKIVGIGVLGLGAAAVIYKLVSR
jgi:hypothetical protein